MAVSPRHQLMQLERLVFKPIDLDAHALVCVAFRRDLPHLDGAKLLQTLRKTKGWRTSRW